MELQWFQTLFARPVDANDSLMQPLVSDLDHLHKLLLALRSQAANNDAPFQFVLPLPESYHYLFHDLVQGKTFFLVQRRTESDFSVFHVF
jgi:hypothetical protein